jgi:hypothetical protein
MRDQSKAGAELSVRPKFPEAPAIWGPYQNIIKGLWFWVKGTKFSESPIQGP